MHFPIALVAIFAAYTLAAPSAPESGLEARTGTQVCGRKGPVNFGTNRPSLLVCSRPDGDLVGLCCNSFGCDNGPGPANYGGNPIDPATKNNCNCNCST